MEASALHSYNLHKFFLTTFTAIERLTNYATTSLVVFCKPHANARASLPHAHHHLTQDRGGTPAGSVFRVVDCADARRNGTYRASTQRNKDGKFTEDGKFGHRVKQTFCSTTRPSSTIFWNELYKHWATNGGRWTGTDGWYNTQDTDTPPTSGWLNGNGVHVITSEPATMEIVYL